jgi:hypothetical protein
MEPEIQVVNIPSKLKSIVEFKGNNCNEDQTANTFYNDVIKGKSVEEIQTTLGERVSTEEIAELLLTEPTADNGGIIALSGFYFQFLISIEYLLELIEGKWDYILIDHHQDIVVFNEERVRFIQVKTKNQDYCLVSETNLYSEWIQKLFKLDEIFNGTESLTTEFELVTNFLIQNSPTIPVEVYRYNNNYNLNIERNNFFSKIEQYSKGDYENIKGDYLEELLSRFKTTRMDSNDVFDKIAGKIGNLFNSRIKANKEDIDYLIGYICSKCYYPEHPSYQLVTREKALVIREELKNRITSGAREYVEQNDSISKVDLYMAELRETYNGSSHYDILKDVIQEYELELKEHIDQGGSIFSNISRFIERTYSSSRINTARPNAIDSFIKELLDITFFMKLACDGKVTINKEHNIFLLKVIGNENINFFNLLDIDDFKSGKAKFLEIFKMCNFQEKKQLFKNNFLKVIFSGDFGERNFPKEHIFELQISDVPSSQELINKELLENEEEIGVSIAKVTYKASIINGNKSVVKELFRQRATLNDTYEYKNFIRSELR